MKCVSALQANIVGQSTQQLRESEAKSLLMRSKSQRDRLSIKKRFLNLGSRLGAPVGHSLPRQNARSCFRGSQQRMGSEIAGPAQYEAVVLHDFPFGMECCAHWRGKLRVDPEFF
jgi:hypothetical protein